MSKNKAKKTPARRNYPSFLESPLAAKCGNLLLVVLEFALRIIGIGMVIPMLMFLKHQGLNLQSDPNCCETKQCECLITTYGFGILFITITLHISQIITKWAYLNILSLILQGVLIIYMGLAPEEMITDDNIQAFAVILFTVTGVIFAIAIGMQVRRKRKSIQ
jgi:hypothetical protein